METTGTVLLKNAIRSSIITFEIVLLLKKVILIWVQVGSTISIWSHFHQSWDAIFKFDFAVDFLSKNLISILSKNFAYLL